MSARTTKRGKVTRSKRGMDPNTPQQEKNATVVQRYTLQETLNCRKPAIDTPSSKSRKQKSSLSWCSGVNAGACRRNQTRGCQGHIKCRPQMPWTSNMTVQLPNLSFKNSAKVKTAAGISAKAMMFHETFRKMKLRSR